MPVKIILWVGLYYLAINLLTLSIWGWDKLAAMRHTWRTPERTLRGLIWCGGFAGGLAGMQLFRHKTRHPGFYRVIAASLALHACVLAAGVYLFLK